MAKSLRLADDLHLPLSFATKTAAILAQRRKGKTYTASVIAEEMVAVKQPFVALDPTGAWWGLRASADGKSEGLPVVILGGQHGDVKLERTAGRLVADLVVDEPGYYVIDFSLFESGEAERQFAVDFAERLYRAKGQPGKNFPLHLFVDEADRFIPQVMRKGSNDTSPRLLGAFEAIVRRGGLRGLGTTLISQRAAVVNKNVLEMLDVLFVLRTVGPNDRKAIDGYIAAHGTDLERAALMESLASLAIGEAWVWEPGAEPPLFQRVQFRRRRTFNSSATPDVQTKSVEPRLLAPVDLEALNKRMAETIERAKADDPKELRRQLAAVRQELVKAQQVKPSSQQASPAPGKPTPALTAADRAVLEKLAAAAGSVTAMGEDSQRLQIQIAVDSLVSLVWQREREGVERRRAAFLAKLEQKGVQRVLEKLERVSVTPAPVAPRAPQPNQINRPIRQPVRTHVNGTGPGDASVGNSGLRRMLIALAQRPQGLTRSQLGVRAGMSSRSGTFDTYLSRARQSGWVDGSGTLQITDAGLTALGDFEELPTGAALQAHWLNELGSSGAARILRALVDAYPQALTRADLGVAANMSDRSGTFGTYLSRLRTLELVQGRGEIRASEELFG